MPAAPRDRDARQTARAHARRRVPTLTDSSFSDAPPSRGSSDDGAHNADRILNTAARLAQVGHWRYDLATRELSWSDEVKRIHGVGADFVPTIETALAAYDSVERERVRATVDLALSAGASYSYESQVVRPDGTRRDVAASCSVERLPGGEIVGLIGLFQDITDLKEIERERDRLLERFTLAARAGAVGIWDLDLATGRVVWDDTMFALFGIERGTGSLEHVWRTLVHPADFERVEAEVQDAIATTSGIDSEFRAIRPDGSQHVIRSLATVVRDRAGRAVRIVGTNWDITEVRTLAEQLRAEKDALSRSEERYRALSEAIPQMVAVDDLSGFVEYVNPRWTHYTGLTLDDVRRSGSDRVIDAEGIALIDSYRRHAPPREFECEVRLRRSDGVYRWHLFRSVPFAQFGRPDGWIVSATDIEDRKNADARLARAAAELAHLAHHDPLTNLPNRKLLMDRLAQAIAQAERDGARVMVLYLDLDRFKAINDRLGHAAGDAVLAETAVRLVKALRTGDTVSRVGGDEFVLVCAEHDGAQEPALLAGRLLTILGQPIDADGTLVTVGASIGISRYPADDGDPDALVRKADAAMYAAKQSGRHAFRAFTPDMTVSVAEQLQFEAELHAAIARKEFVVYYQPMIDLQSGELLGAEALVRWNHPSRGLLQPGAFVAFAEEQGLIAQIGESVVHDVCAQIDRLDLDPAAEFSIAINVSAQQFGRPGFVADLAAAVATYGVDVRRLEIEITESTVMGNTAATIAVLRALKELGVRLSLDDFGTGYSSLAYIKNFPIDTLKIDRSFVRDIATDRTDQALAKTIITLAHSLGMRVIGEGVETSAQIEILRAFGSDCAQGYLISHPLTADAFERFREAYRPAVVVPRG